jgi:hypothetical protein
MVRRRSDPQLLLCRYSKPFGMLAFASAAARAAIHPDRNAVSSDGGLDLL